MQGMAIKIDIKLNIDDLNWSLDGQIIDNMKQENGHFYQFLTKIEILSSVSLEPEKMDLFHFTQVYVTLSQNISV